MYLIMFHGFKGPQLHVKIWEINLITKMRKAQLRKVQLPKRMAKQKKTHQNLKQQKLPK